MAQKIKLAKGREFTFKAPSKGGSSKFAWDEWLNGDLLMIEQSEGDKDEKGNTVEATVTAKKDGGNKGIAADRKLRQVRTQSRG